MGGAAQDEIEVAHRGRQALEGQGLEAPQQARLLQARRAGRRAELELDVVQEEHSSSRVLQGGGGPAEAAQDVAQVGIGQIDPVELPLRSESDMQVNGGTGIRVERVLPACVRIPTDSGQEEIDLLAA